MVPLLTKKWAYYNDNDPRVCAWVRELIKADLIAPGEVDERSITDVQPADLMGFRQVHMFCGIGGWSYALRLAGWSDERAVWTGSCPCQPWSTAGKGAGADDPRDLWYAWFRLIRKRRPAVVFGEQVASGAAWSWIDRVCHDMEHIHYAVGAIDLPAASIGAPHIRQRLWFVADANGDGRDWERVRLQQRQSREAGPETTRCRIDALADSSSQGLQVGQEPKDGRRDLLERRQGGQAPTAKRAETPWSGAVWERGADGMQRAVKPGLRVMAHGVPGRVGQIRGFGNAIVPAVAAEIIAAYMDITDRVGTERQ